VAGSIASLGPRVAGPPKVENDDVSALALTVDRDVERSAATTARQPDFGESDKLLLARLLPALEGLARRSVRVGGELALAEVARRAQLTAAETEVLGLLSRGLSDRQIARRRFVSPATVHTHVGRILAKLEVRSRVQAALLARGLDIEHDDEG